MKSVIKPCPFCGSIPKVDTSMRKTTPSMYGEYAEVRQRVIIECEACGLHKDIVAVRTVPMWLEWKDVKEICRDAARSTIENFWNKRWNAEGENG